MITTVKQLLNTRHRGIIAVTPDTLVIDAIKVMSDRKVGALAVLEHGKLVGILSERDYTRKVVINNKHSSDTPVMDIMTTEVKTVSLCQTIEECMIIMSDNHIRHLPVLDGDKPVTVISIMDVLKNIINEKEFIIEQLEHYITDTA